MLADVVCMPPVIHMYTHAIPTYTTEHLGTTHLFL